MTGLFAPRFENKVQKNNPKTLQAHHYENIAPTWFFLQSKRRRYRASTVHFTMIHKHFSQTFKPSICLHKNSLFDALRTGRKVTTNSWTPFCGSIGYSSPAPNDITACAGVGDVLAELLNSGRKRRHLYLCQWVVKAGGLQARCVAGVWVNQRLRSSTRPRHGFASPAEPTLTFSATHHPPLTRTNDHIQTNSFFRGNDL